MTTPFVEGERAYKAGKSAENKPNPSGSAAFIGWANGWRAAAMSALDMITSVILAKGATPKNLADASTIATCTVDISSDEMLSCSDIQLATKYPQYHKALPAGTTSIDTYMVNQLFPVDDPSGCIIHARKKLLIPGVRTGGKSMVDDVREARDTLNRWLQINWGEK